MDATHPHSRVHVASASQISVRARLLAVTVAFTLLGIGPAAAQEADHPPLRLGSVVPGGVRASATESWGLYECEVTNPTDQDRKGRVYLFYPTQPEVQFGREMWLPAHATISSWILAGPP